MRFLSGHWALSLQKLPLLRFHSCAWVVRFRCRGGCPHPPAKPSPLGEGGWPQARRMRGTLPVMRVVRFNCRDGPVWPPALCKTLCRARPPGRAALAPRNTGRAGLGPAPTKGRRVPHIP